VFLQLRCCEGTKKYLSVKRPARDELLYLMDRNPPEIYRTRRESNIKMNLKGGWENMDQIYLAQEKTNLAWFFEHGKGTSSFIKCGNVFTGRGTICVSMVVVQTFVNCINFEFY